MPVAFESVGISKRLNTQRHGKARLMLGALPALAKQKLINHKSHLSFDTCQKSAKCSERNEVPQSAGAGKTSSTPPPKRIHVEPASRSVQRAHAIPQSSLWLAL